MENKKLNGLYSPTDSIKGFIPQKQTCLNCNDCTKIGNSYFCVAEDDRVKLPLKNLTTDQTDCSLFEVKYKPKFVDLNKKIKINPGWMQ